MRLRVRDNLHILNVRMIRLVFVMDPRTGY